MSSDNKVVSIRKKSKVTPTNGKKAAKKVHRTTSLKVTSERKKLFCDVIERLAEYQLADVAKGSGVSYSTLYNWCYGETVSPILRTVLDVCEVIDLDVILVDTYSVQKSTRATQRKQS